MYLQANLATVLYGRHIRGYDGVNPRRLGGLQRLAHRIQVLLIQDDIEGKVTLHPRLAAYAADLRQIIRAEVVSRMRAHVQLSHTEVNGVRSALYGGVQAFEIACRSHYFQFFILHVL